MSFLKQFKRSLAIAEKNIKIYYFKGPVIVFGVLLPVFLLLAFYIGRSIPPDLLASGLISMTLFFASSAVSPVISPWEARMKTLERLISTPVSISTIVLGDILASSAFGIALTLIPIVIDITLLVEIANLIIFTLSILLADLCFSSLGVLLSAYPTDIPADTVMLSTLIKFPLIFVSGVLIPLENLPHWGILLASISPLTYFNDLIRFSIQNISFYPVQVDFIILTLFTALFLALSIKLHEKTILKRI